LILSLSIQEKNRFKFLPARILRGLRVAARLGFQFSSETSTAIRDLSPSIINIDKVYYYFSSLKANVQVYMNSHVFFLFIFMTAFTQSRLMMEMRYMLCHGAAESSIRLLSKYGLLDILLPFQVS
jgi:tRNA nucleotidyltransferase/poly(A) polymerase